jgi:hypothetical protein
MSFQGSSHGLSVSVELNVPGLGSTDEMNNLDLVAVAEICQGKEMKLGGSRSQSYEETSE